MKFFMIALGMAGPLWGAPLPVLLELFTSQGCSSCPPADALLEQLEMQQPVAKLEIIPLAFHIDYWNNLGWTDPFSSKAFTQRQYGYAATLKIGNVYTPQAVINGAVECVGSDRTAILGNLKALQRLHLQRRESGLEISGLIPERELFVALSQDGLTTEIKRGENRGRTLTSRSVVLHLEPLAFQGSTALWPIPPEATGLNVVVFQQMPGLGPVLSAGRMKL